MIARRAAAAAWAARTTRRRRTAARAAVAVAADRTMWSRLRTVAGHLALTHATGGIDVPVRMAMARAAPIRRIARRAIVGAGMIAGPTVVAAVAVEQAAVSARAAVLDIPAAPHRRIASDDRSRRLTRLATRIAAGVTTTRTSMRTNRSATGSREHRQREHDKRAFHLSPLRTSLRLAAVRKERVLGARLGRYHWYRRHNRQNPTNRKWRVQGSGFGVQYAEMLASRSLPT
jgi:hypothetical protein